MAILAQAKTDKFAQPITRSGGNFYSTATWTNTPVYLDMRALPYPVTVTVIPGVGNTSVMEFSTTPNAFDNPGAAVWQSWDAGNVASTTTLSIVSPITAARFSRVSGSSTDTYEVVA